MPNTQPPKWANKLLEWFCRKDLLEYIQGDLYELYEVRINKKGPVIAKVRFILDMLSVCRPFVVKLNSNNYAMLKNYLKVTYRNILRHKVYSSIKIGGLALGIAACILIGIFIQDEMIFDKKFKDSERIYRMVNVWSPPEKTIKWPAQQPPMLGVIQNEIPEVEIATRIVPYGRMLAGNNLIRRSDHTQNTYEEGFIYADAHILEVFDLRMIYGDQKTALTAPKTLLLSKAKAEQYFPNEDPTGKTIIFNDDNTQPYRIDGVIEDLPSHTHLDFDFIITLNGAEMWPGEHTSWCCTNFDIYLKLNENAAPANVEEKLLGVRDSYIANYLRERGRSDVSELQYRSFELQNIENIHLYSGDISDNYTHGEIKIVWMFGGIAVLILTLACMNFINLSTAKSTLRAKEVGLRKVVGSQKSDVVFQFLTESIFYSMLALVFGLALAFLALPFFNQIADKSLYLPFTTWWFLPFLFGGVLIVGAIAGIYPAIYLSSFQPIVALKGLLNKRNKYSIAQNPMVVFQFVVSIVLITSAIVVNNQMEFVLNKKLGFDKEQIVLLRGTNTLGQKLKTLTNELKKIGEVQNVTTSPFLPLEGMAQDGNEFWLVGRTKEDAPINGQLWRVDHNYITTLNMKLKEGRDFDPNLVSDSSSIIINESMAVAFGFENPIGTTITNGYETPRTIIGVVEDFHFRSMKGKIDPLSLVLGNQPDITVIKVQSDDLRNTMSKITTLWNEIVPNQPIRFEFMEDTFASMYDDVKRTSMMFSSFSFLAIIIACLGLFAMTTFLIEQKRKEISVRKVLGASVPSLIKVLIKNFIIIICISLLISIPLGYYAMSEWLQNFAYRITLSWDVFLLSAVLITLISGLTILYEIARAIMVNPADTLQSE